MLAEKLPDIAAAVAAPLQQVDRIVMVNTGNGNGTGVDQITKGVTDVLAQVPGVVEMISGVDLPELLKQVPGLRVPSDNGGGHEEEETPAPAVVPAVPVATAAA